MDLDDMQKLAEEADDLGHGFPPDTIGADRATVLELLAAARKLRSAQEVIARLVELVDDPEFLHDEEEVTGDGACPQDDTCRCPFVAQINAVMEGWKP
jgi:hypothetical protein